MSAFLCKAAEKQGTPTILGYDWDPAHGAGSLRRTLSADMSSRRRPVHLGLYQLKKTASSEGFPAFFSAADSSSSSESEEESEEEWEQLRWWEEFGIREATWAEEEEKAESERPAQSDVWASILAQKAEESSKSEPYVHPLLKKSSLLSEKSLEMCTERLGSETGSDDFFWFQEPEMGFPDESNKEERRRLQPQQEGQEHEKEPLLSDSNRKRVEKYKKSSLRPFPPPLHSLSNSNRPCVGMRPIRENGRLVLEAVPVPSPNCLCAQRQDGRLVLSVVSNAPAEEQSEEDWMEEELKPEELDDAEKSGNKKEDDGEEAEEVEEIEKGCGAAEIRSAVEQAPETSTALIDVARAAIIVKQLTDFVGANGIWPHELINSKEEETTPFPSSLPPPPPLARLIPASPAAANAKAYECRWRSKPMAATVLSSLTQYPPPNKPIPNSLIIASGTPAADGRQQQVLLLRGEGARDLVPLLRGCKELRQSSVVILEPYCIATT